MNSFINKTLFHLCTIFCGYWVFLTATVGLWLILGATTLLTKENREKEAQIAFWGGWFWLSFGLITFSSAKIFSYYF